MGLDIELRKSIGDAIGSYARRRQQDPQLQTHARSVEDQLGPDRRKQGELFTLDLLDYALKDDIDSMDQPIFCVSPSAKHKKDYVWESPDGKSSLHIQEISSLGRPLYRDKDINIYIISQLVAMKNDGLKIDPRQIYTVKLKAYDFLQSTNRPTGKKQYKELLEALDRLAGLRFKTTRESEDGNKTITENLSLISGYTAVRFKVTEKDKERHRVKEQKRLKEIKRLVEGEGVEIEKAIKKVGEKEELLGRLSYIKIDLSPWLVKQIANNRYLTISRDYFRLKSGLDRRLYEIARKGCGSKHRWPISLGKLHHRTGTKASLPELTRELREAIKSDHIPDSGLSFLGTASIKTR